MFGAVDVALASDLVPDREQAGRWMTIYNGSAGDPFFDPPEEEQRAVMQRSGWDGIATRQTARSIRP